MKAMILAAGLGKRMRPLTDSLPKPLLPVGGKPLIQYHVENLQRAGITELIINLAYRGEQIREFLGGGEQFGVSIQYSQEPEPLETGGAILQALPLLGDQPFLLVNGDVWTDVEFSQLSSLSLPESCLGHLFMVQNPEHNPLGDFVLDQGLLKPRAEEQGFTFSGISLIDPVLVSGYPQARENFPLRECFFWAMEKQALRGQVLEAEWWDIGTPERLAQLDAKLQ
ncbi:nucleotidyltransferase family protein [Maricurvus nonylphenolicus]|uniref:N-acetylmuramate alpha-1-phosphate uridylyltransferase MurU n=1 Tax=Maricurvus nonylphenolicus TaxID=1008307 RepID=UPI0036F3EEA2